MYPIERFLGTLKGYVTNRVRPEGSIAEAYIVKECLTVCSMEHRNTIQNPEAHDISQIQRDTFPKWFKQRMNDLRNQGSPEATDVMWSLANGLGSIVYLYSGCIFNGVRFHTRDRKNRRKCQNSGLVVQGEHIGKTIDFYGYLCKVWELTYLHGGRVVLFQCEWYNTEGEFATAFANLLGEAIRDEAPVRKEGWKIVPEGIKKLVIKRVQQIFEFGDYVNDLIIKAAVDAKCQKLYRN
ncbi:hypothetical protein AAC387_Pa06g1468 [Persea americana]